jgi:hypothetical protein
VTKAEGTQMSKQEPVNQDNEESIQYFINRMQQPRNGVTNTYILIIILFNNSILAEKEMQNNTNERVILEMIAR